jgi:hypothetical protein
MDTSIEDAMNVHRQDGTIMQFKEFIHPDYIISTQERKERQLYKLTLEARVRTTYFLTL